jgi:trk system potassium uptake protein TrkH
MRNRMNYFLPIFEHLGALFWVFGFVMLVPLLVLFLYRNGDGHAAPKEVPVESYLVPAAIALVLGLALKRRWAFKPLDVRRAMLLCALAWILLSGIAALPFMIGLRASFLDGYFEAVSGFTTTGATVFQGLDHMPRSILFWRSLMQWLGGMGILTFFIVVATAGGSAHTLFGAESHETLAKAPTPGLFHTLKIIWTIYVGLTALTAAALVVEGLSLYDALSHAFTAISTAGFSPYDASVEHFRKAGYANFVAIEYTLMVAMLLGGTNFFVHYRLLRGEGRALWDTFEVRFWWLLIAAASALVILDHCARFGVGHLDDTVRNSMFQVVSLASTTGFTTKDIADPYFPSLSKLVFLALMVMGACAGSTGGGLKLLRIGVLFKAVGRQVKRLIYGPSVVTPIVIDGAIVHPEEVRRIGALVFAWVCCLAVGAGAMAFASDLEPFQAVSGMASVLGNVGPSDIPAQNMPHLHPAAKMIHILGMLAGRLEILPLLLLFSRRAWK